MEHGFCSVEIVQAINLLTQWKKGDDPTSWQRVGYAIRMAQELKLNIKAPRPLPLNERQAREILNKERAWLNLIIADYHLAIHHTLPKMIHDDTVDPVEWMREHPQIVCPGEALLAPLVEFSRLCRLYADMLAAMSKDASSLRMLEWIEMAWKRWRTTWLSDTRERIVSPKANKDGFELPLQQTSTIKMDDAYFRFHVAEFKLLYTSRYRSQGEPLDSGKPTPLSLAFSECVDASLGVSTCFQEHFVLHNFLPYAFNRVWVALAVTSVWLVKNINAMSPGDRSRVIRTLADLQQSTEDASRSSDDMSAYTHRLIKHLLSGIPPEWQFTSIMPNRSHALSTLPPVSDFSLSAPADNGWAVSSAQEIIQDQLWNPNHPTSSKDAAPTTPLLDASHEPSRQKRSFLQSNHGTPGLGINIEELLFPEADDEFWRILFPADSITL